jgi:transposase
MWTAAEILLTAEERGELERRVASPTTQQRDVKRAQVVLLAADGMPSRQISVTIGMHESHVANWRQRFLAERLAGLSERKHTGRPRRLGHDDRVAMAAAATAEKSPDDPVAMWTLDELVDVLADKHDISVSRSQLGKILAAMDIDLRKVRGWLNRRDDPEFWTRVRDVCGLYLNPPDQAIVLSVDEKTGIQAKERIAKDQPARPGRVRRREFEYRRHGIAKLVAALDVGTGQVLADTIPRNDSDNFCAFLATVDTAVDPALAIHVILDNGSSHTSKQTGAWFRAHPRWEVHFTPKHASWVNQVELFFSILQRKVIRNGSFGDLDDLITKMMRFITDYDQTARPFKWTYAADPLKAA